MQKFSGKKENITFASLFLIIPTIMLIFGYYYFTYPMDNSLVTLIQIPMFLGMGLIFIGFLIRFFTKDTIGNILKSIGWIIFAFYWSTQPSSLYFGEDNDIFNAAVCVIGVYVLFYFAYHEWLSYVRKEEITSLNWIAGASALSGLIYFGIERSFLAQGLIDIVSEQSVSVYNLIIGKGSLNPGTSDIYVNGEYAATIIFACTAIQAMVIFVGMIGALPKIGIKRRIIGLAVTLIPIYILNLLRNAMVVFLVGNDITDFFMAHNVISKAGALVTLIVLLLIVIRIIPEILDEIINLTDIYKRGGPLEKTFSKFLGKKQK